MTIDSHQHFWKYDPVRYSWINNSMAVLQRDFLPTDLKKVFDKNGVDGCVAVQADQSLEETDFLLKLAKENDFIKGVVGWIDLRDPKVNETLQRYSGQEKLKGFRHVVQDEPDHNFLLRHDFLRGVAHLEAHNLTYDILTFPHQLGAALEFVKRFPNHKFVIDHISKPYIKDGFYDGWALLMKEIAQHENVYCKLSGMVTEANMNSWKAQDITRYMELVMEVFGTDRVMYGSDWPVCLLAGKYGEIKNLVTDFIAPLSENEQKAVMGQNAINFYNL